MGIAPNLGPGYQPAAGAGLAYDEILAAKDLDVLWVMGANPHWYLIGYGISSDTLEG